MKTLLLRIALYSLLSILSTISFGQNNFPGSGTATVGHTGATINFRIFENSNSKTTFVSELQGSGQPRLEIYHYSGSVNQRNSLVFGNGAFEIYDKTNSASRFWIDKTTGNIGIGTFNPQDKLSVNGNILCEQIKVIANVPSSDYVFEEDYPLMSLGRLENYIKKNKHLPEIPSAEEFKENGYKLGDMDDLLLRKVEELTLHIIQLEKRIKDLE